ncbi:MAG: transcription termination/antitermination protein NusG [Rickettsiaceae bacterium]|nr:transcription termination/antitermination protein NusG [Rickettsiaceae bacterium]
MDKNYNWYIIQVAPGSEKRVKETIIEQARKKDMSDCFEQILVPSIEMPETKKGKKVLVEKKTMPGYIFLRMLMNDDSWHLVKSAPKVLNFLGDGKNPTIVSEQEIRKTFSQLEEAAQTVSRNIEFMRGDNVEITEGPFAFFAGTIEDVDEKKNKLTVFVKIFGRDTSIEVSFNQAKKK